MSNTFFTSDTHFNHANILKFCPDSRLFSKIEEMNEGLVKNWNSVVSPSDTIWHLGDVMWGQFDINRLNGEKHLIIGNHDNFNLLRGFFKSIQPYHELKGMIPKTRALALMHYPIESWNGKYHGSIHLHGHTHNTLDNSGLLRFDVGVDCWEMKPISIEDVLALVPKRKEEAEKLLDKDSKRLKEKYSARDDGFKHLNEVADSHTKE